ncbi:MAG: hypothetical protein HOP28_07715 [Gemmatimonadales bacterium]|nr:hypothetical protein [Gemmatimonadales bacterium]
MRRIRSFVFTALAVAMSGACSSGGDGGTDPGPTPSIALALGATAATIVQGGSAPVTATLTRSGGFAGTVSLDVEGEPAGVTASVGAPSTSGGSTTATVTILVGAATAPGVYPLTVRGTGSGVAAATASFTLTITAAPSYTLALSVPAASIVQGGNGQVTVTLLRTSFPDAVTLAVTGLPAGVSAAFAPAAPTGSTSTLTLIAGAAAAPGTYPLQVTGTAGAGNQSQPLSLTVAAAPSYTMALSTAAVSILQGGNTAVTVTLARTNFPDAVALAVTGLPAGVTAAFAPPAPTGATSTLTLTVDASAVAGTYPLQVTGTATAGNQSQPLSLTILAPGISFTLAPAAVTIVQGSSTTTTLTITRNNYTGPVAINMLPEPGITLTAIPQLTNGNTSTLTITAAGSATPGVHNVTIIGNDGSVTAPPALRVGKAPARIIEANATLAVTVTALPPAGPIVLDYSACQDKPLFMAYQDGTSGPWVRVVPVNDVYTLNVTQQRVGWATVQSFLTRNLIQFLSKAELAAMGPAVCGTGSQTTLNVQVANPPVDLFFKASYNGAAPFPFSINGLASFTVSRGVNDVIGYFTRDLNARADAEVAIRRGVDTRGSDVVVNMAPPFQLSESRRVAAAQMTLQNRNGESYTITPRVGTIGSVGSSSNVCIFSSWEFVSGGVNTDMFSAYGIPDELLVPTDVQSLRIDASVGGQLTRQVTEYFRSHTSRAIQLPSALPSIVPSVVAGGTKLLRFQVAVPAEFDEKVSFAYGFNRVLVTVSMSGYVTGGMLDVTAPDLSTLPGWSPVWGLAPGTVSEWQFTAQGGVPEANACQVGNGRHVVAVARGTA